MKAILATATVIITILCARLTAADATPATIPVEQQFQQADVQLAIEQYKKIRLAAFDVQLKLQTETTLSDEQRKQLEDMLKQLQAHAEHIRAEAIKLAAVAVANTR